MHKNQEINRDMVNKTPIADFPSIDEFMVQPENLPSLDELIEDHTSCPKGEYFCNDEKRCKPIPEGHKVLDNGELVKEGTQILDDAEGNPHIEVKDIVPPWPELVRMVNDVRSEIPDIPEIKSYDRELEALCEIIDQIKESIPVVPEVRYYEKELKTLGESIENVKKSIPSLPAWIHKVNEVPDFAWVGKSFNVIDEDFRNVRDTIDTLASRVESNLKEIHDENNTRDFESKSDFKTIHDRVSTVRKDIFTELKEQSKVIWDLTKKLKANQKEFEIVISEKIGGEVDEFKSITTETIQRLESKFVESSESLGTRLDEEVESLGSRISKLPKPKFYEEEIKHIQKELSDLTELKATVYDLQKTQKDLQEGLLNIPPDVDNSDPLTPLDQDYATLEDLSNHYRLFVNRVQQQLATLGGGGTVWLSDLDDVGISTQTVTDGQALVYNADQEKWLAGSTGITGINTTGTSYFKDVEVSGNLDVTGDIVYDEATARNWNITGVATAGRLGVTGVTTSQHLEVTGITTVARIGVTGVTTSQHLEVTGISTLGSSNGIGTVTIGVGHSAIVVDGDGRVTGILTIGTGSITLDGSSNAVNVGTGITIDSSGIDANVLKVGGKNVETELTGKTSIGLAIALG